MLRLQRIDKHYAKVAAPALVAVELDVAAGECVAVTGRSGAGKSTLLHIAGGLLPPDAGVVEVDGDRPWQRPAAAAATFRRRRLGMLLQGSQLFDELDVATNVAMPLLLDRRRDAMPRARDQLGSAGLSSLAARRPAELSAGERVRVAMLRALVARPLLLLVDEPTANLDDESARHVITLLQGAADDGAAVLVVTHDTGLAGACSRRLRLCDGRLA